jgi:hypothetical membrane protein
MQKFRGYTSVGIIGLTAVVIFGLGWLFSTLVDTGWVFGENMLSDLGGPASEARNFFNLGSFFGGLLVMCAGIGIASMKKYRIYAASGVLIAVAGAFLAMIGLFPIDTGNTHNMFAYGLFAAGIFGMIVMCAGDWRYGRTVFGGVTMMLLAIIAITYLVDPLEYTEGVAVLVFLVWFALSCVKISVIKEKL